MVRGCGGVGVRWRWSFKRAQGKKKRFDGLIDDERGRSRWSAGKLGRM